jgi:hypothetical protein
VSKLIFENIAAKLVEMVSGENNVLVALNKNQ